MAEKFLLTSDGERIFYRVRRNKGPLIVFLHGWPHNWHAWKKEACSLETRGFSTILPDLRGHGRSSQPEEETSYSIERFAKDIHELLLKEKAEEAVIIGHSFGGMVCLKFYELYPSSCRALILVDTIYENPLKHMHLEADQVITPLLDHFLSYLLDNSRIHGKHLPEVPLEKFRDSSDFFIWLKSASCTSFKSLIACAKEMLHFNEKKIMSKIRVPVLILEGEKDERTPLDQAIKMARRIKDSSIRIVPGVAHDANIQDPINVSRYILEFLKGCGEHTREEKCSTGFK